MGGFRIVGPGEDPKTVSPLPPKTGGGFSIGKPAQSAQTPQTPPVPPPVSAPAAQPQQASPQPTPPPANAPVTYHGGYTPSPPPPPSAGQRFKSGIGQGVSEMLTQPVSDLYHGVMDAPRDSTEQLISQVHILPFVGSLTPQGIPLSVYRLGKMAYQDTKDTYEYATKTGPAQAAEYFAKGQYPEAVATVMSVANPGFGKIVGPRTTELMQGVRPGGDLITPLTKDVTEGVITALLEKAPEALAKGVEAGKSVPAALNKAKLVAAANDVLGKSSTSFLKQIVDGLTKAKATDVAAEASKIVNADKAYTASTNVPASTVQDLAQKLAQAVLDKNATQADLSATKQVYRVGAKGQIQGFLSRYTNGMLSWDDLKDLKNDVYGASRQASGKDSAVLGQFASDINKLMKDRASLVGHDLTFEKYTATQKAITDVENGIMTKLIQNDTGLKFWEDLTKASHKPQLNDLFNLAHLPKESLDAFVQDHEPLARLAKSADGNTGALAGRLQALARHPFAAGSAGAATMMLPLPAKYILSLITMGKAGEFMNRIDAATALRTKFSSLTTPPLTLTPPSGTQAPGTPPPPGTPPAPKPVGVSPSPTPTSGTPPASVPPTPGVPGGPAAVASATPPATPPATGPGSVGGRVSGSMDVQRATAGNVPYQQAQYDALILRAREIINNPAATLEEKMIAASQLKGYKEQLGLLGKTKPAEAPKTPEATTPKAPDFTRGTEKVGGIDVQFAQTKDGIKVYTKPEMTDAQVSKMLTDQRAMRDARGIKTEAPKEKGGVGNVEKGQDGQVQGQEKGQEGKNVRQEGQKVTTPRPRAYEKFGVKVDPSKWTTPEEVVQGKADAVSQLKEGVLRRVTEIREAIKNGTMDTKAATDAGKELVADEKKAKASIDKIKTPNVGRAARDRIVKGAKAAGALGEEVVTKAREQAATDFEDETVAALDTGKYEKLFGDAGHSDLFNKLFKAHFDKYDGEYALLNKQLEAAYNAIKKAKK